MAEINPKEPLKPKELPTCSKTFEHLFPGNRWNDLVLFNPLNVPHLLGEILWSGAERENKLIKASGRTKESLAARENFAFVDQLSMGYATLDLTPVDDKFNVTEVVDLINIQAGEKWGAGIRPVSYLSEASKNSGNLLMDITRGNNPYETVTEMAIGILGQNNKPVGLIHYHKGEKPRTSKKVRQDSPVLIGTFNLGLQPVAVTL